MKCVDTKLGNKAYFRFMNRKVVVQDIDKNHRFKSYQFKSKKSDWTNIIYIKQSFIDYYI